MLIYVAIFVVVKITLTIAKVTIKTKKANNYGSIRQKKLSKE